jgi:hypothetical protein
MRNDQEPRNKYNVFNINGKEQEMKLIVLLSFDNDRDLDKPDAL